uniref:Uncharacterized protein n=1 Tax=Rhizophora mucronata TaxID=61149 RepID=A0A2P2PDE8_RHIMU
MQVVELEESRKGLLKENQQPRESISGLQSQVQNPEMSISSAKISDGHGKHTSEQEELNSQIEAASALIDKLITENLELVEKVPYRFSSKVSNVLDLVPWFC